MKKIATLLLCSVLMLAACSDDEDIQPAQKTKIVSYLTTTHLPKLVDEMDVDAGSNTQYYTIIGDAVYRYITDVYNPDRENWAQVTPASKVTITYRGYVFSYTNIVATGAESSWTVPFYTNDAAFESFMQKSGLNTSGWSFQPETIDMRHPKIINGLYEALLGCREGDSVEAFMTYNKAYGDAYFSIIPKESPVVFFFTVDAVE